VQRVGLLIIAFLFSANLYAQVDLRTINDTEQSFEQAAQSKGAKVAFLAYLADDAIVFRPEPVNGKEFWRSHDDLATMLLSRNVTYSDVASNGLMGYTTGNWRLYPRGKSESGAKFGQYVTIWEKKVDGKFYATIDIAIEHEKLPFSVTDLPMPGGQSHDPNKRGWSPADASMKFLRTSMSGSALGGAYQLYAGKDVRLLRDAEPPIIGKKNVISETRHYVSVKFPEKVVLYQSADMAYTWNPCEYANSNEGMEKGNCLHIWKLRNKKWWIVLGVFSRVPNETPPTLKMKQRNTASQ